MRYYFRTFVGPCAVNETAGRLVDAGVDARAGVSHVYGYVEAWNRDAAVAKLNSAAGWRIVRPYPWGDVVHESEASR